MKTVDARLLDRIRLHLVPGVGPRIHRLLLETFGSSTAVLSATQSQLLSVPRVGTKLAAAIGAAVDAREAQRVCDHCHHCGIQLVPRPDAPYPPLLSEIPDPPELLYLRGRLDPVDQLAIAIVGSRRCTSYGRRFAERITGGLARSGLTIVSGLARGIDAVAHRAALAAGGRTVAVLATGLEQIYPPEHESLANDISEHGAVLSEARLDQTPVAGLFPQRNRIISGLSLGVVVIEASRRSGALHTARHAIEQGREVFALPGPVDSPASQGCLDLLRDGARLIQGVDDILDELGPLIQPVAVANGPAIHVPRELLLNEHERLVLGIVAPDPRHLDELLRASPLENSMTLATLTVLEMKRLVRRLPGSYLIRVG